MLHRVNRIRLQGRQLACAEANDDEYQTSLQQMYQPTKPFNCETYEIAHHHLVYAVPEEDASHW